MGHDDLHRLGRKKNETGGTRTHDLGIKSAMLYQLSYGLVSFLHAAHRLPKTTPAAGNGGCDGLAAAREPDSGSFYQPA